MSKGKFFVIFFVVLIYTVQVLSQTANTDTTQLEDVSVQAFYNRTRWQAMPASVAVIRSADLKKTPTHTLLPVMNNIPGIRMEERSPGSYRFSVRGSLLRSPFGVRNVKIYWNQLPLSDGGGNTYLNLVDIGQINAATILKGPVASVYGAGTGGALLLRSELNFNRLPDHDWQAGISGGSYGFFQQHALWQYSDSFFSSQLKQVHMQSDGYRQQSAMRRDGMQWLATFKGKKQLWQLLNFYTDLFYQTPGGITETQFLQNPQQARQPAGMFLGAVQQQTAVYNKTWYSGVHHEWEVDTNNSFRSFLVLSGTHFRNPFITNYEQRQEWNTGIGTQWQYRLKKNEDEWSLHLGVEWLYQHAGIDNFSNKNGIKDTVQYRDQTHSTQWFPYLQVQYRIRQRWTIQAGISSNQQGYRYQRLTDPQPVHQRRKITSVLTPRISAGYSINQRVTLYALLTKGFSAPTLAEFRPSDGNFYADLDAESGWNMETGIKGYLFSDRLQFDIAWYRFKLNNAIVRRNALSGAEYFVNAGGAIQQGLELFVKMDLLHNDKYWLRRWSCWTAYSFQPYTFTDYRQGAIDYSNNRLTGVPRNTWITGMDIETQSGLYLYCSMNAVSAIPLNDANDAYAKAYQLLQARTGYRKNRWEFFLSLDNGLNQIYSLGNDINAVGRRYYNAAAPRNFSFGMNFGLRR